MFKALRIGVFLLVVFAGGSPRAGGNDAEQGAIRVITSGGFAAAYDQLAPLFKAETGINLHTAYGSSSGGAPDSIPVRLHRGEHFDIIILSRPSLDNLTHRGYVRAEERRDLVRSLIGMAVQTGAIHPDISTTGAFVTALRRVKSFGYSASASGTYLSTDLLPRLGLWEELAPKSKRILSERVAAVVARGEVEVGFQQISEILPIPGAEFVGPIPDEYQKVTVFSAGITVMATDVRRARLLMDFLSSSPAADVIRQTGLEPVADGKT